MKLKTLLSAITETAIKIGVTPPKICGGVARDKYLGELDKISDLDLTNGEKTIDYLSQELTTILRKKYNVTRQIMQDGHSSIYIGNIKLDFSSNFIVPNINNILSKLNINNPTNMQREIFSRDFTCNALLLSFDLKNIEDLTHKGFEDIKKRVIRTCLAPEITLTSNKNRVARAIYLASKLNFNVDDSIINYVKQHPESIKISTQKSLTSKIEEAFKWDADKANYLITKMNLWEYIPVTDIVYPHYEMRAK